MKKIKYIFKLSCVFCIALLSYSCDEDDDFTTEEPQPELVSGEADFSVYVSIGNSLTSGYTDGALFKAGQQNSLANLLAQKFALVDGTAFTQPLMTDNIGGLLIGGQPNPRFPARLIFDGSGPVRLTTSPTTEALATLSGPFTNMGVPGAKSTHILFDGYGNPQNLALGTANPYFVRFASSPSTTILQDALTQGPTFFSYWLGGQDVLGYATTGGDGTDPITDKPTFDFAVNTAISALVSTGAKGVMANIPDLNSLPHFTTVPYNPLSSSDPSFGPQIPLLNTIYGAINDVYAFLNVTGRNISFATEGNSGVVIRDETLPDLSAEIAAVLGASPSFPAFVQQFGLPAEAAPLVAQLLGATYGQARQATPDDLFVLPSSSVIGTVNTETFEFLVSQGLPQALAGQFSVEGITNPLADKWVLIPSEQDLISTAVQMFNQTLESVASQNGLAFVDVNDILNKLKAGALVSGDFILTSNLVTGGAISLDGIHPTARGYALLANEFLKAIDETYGSNFEASGNLYDIGDFPVNYPASLQ